MSKGGKLKIEKENAGILRNGNDGRKGEVRLGEKGVRRNRKKGKKGEKEE